MTLERRALWLQETSSGVVKSLGIEYTVEGKPPSTGLVVANHLSYLDIAILSSAMPCFFIAKREVARWPFFGEAARKGGTLFLERMSLASANGVAREIEARLRLQVPVLLFPEGTSTDGAHVLRFHSRLFQPAIETASPITAAAIRYLAEDGPDGTVPERELCWYGDESFLPHLWKVMGVRRFSAHVQFGQPRIYPDRRAASHETHAEVTAKRAAGDLVLAQRQQN